MIKTKRFLMVVAAFAFVASSVATFAAPRSASAAYTSYSLHNCLNGTNYAPYRPMLSVSSGPGISRGQCVANLQGFLRNAGGYRNLVIDANFGPATQAAVKDMQTKTNLRPVDGIVGEDTWNVLAWFCYYTTSTNYHFCTTRYTY